MKIQVEIPADKLDEAVKKLKRELEKANNKVSKLEAELATARNQLALTAQMKKDFEDVCNRYAEVDSNSYC